jgi:hypothetical protein
MFKSILIIFINIITINQQVIASNNGRSWLYPCSQGQCLDPIESCLQTKCIGVEQCTDCVAKESFTCKSCINEVFNKLNLVKGELICSIDDPLQEKVCEMYCRGQFKNKSKCQRNENQIPRCLCFNDNETITTTSKPSTTSTTTTTKVTETSKTTTIDNQKEIKCKYNLNLNVVLFSKFIFFKILLFFSLILNFFFLITLKKIVIQ